MKVSVKVMVLKGESPPPTVVETTLQTFFIEDVQEYQDPIKYPFTPDCREGGCQFAFDRDVNAPIRCINCNAAPCQCPGGTPVVDKRYALQRFTETRVYILDIDLNSRPRGSGTVNKYHPLLYEEELLLRETELRFLTIPKVLFFYRTKCNGFRIGFESDDAIRTKERYEELCGLAEQAVARVLPGGRVTVQPAERSEGAGRPLRWATNAACK